MGQRNLITVQMELDQLSKWLCAWVFAVKGGWTQSLGAQHPSSPVSLKPAPAASRRWQGRALLLGEVLENGSASRGFRRRQRLLNLSGSF